MKNYLMVIFGLIMSLNLLVKADSQIINNETNYVTKASAISVTTIDNKLFLLFRSPEGNCNLEVDPLVVILLDDNMITKDDFLTLKKDDYSAWVWQLNNRVIKIVLAKNSYQIKIKAIDPSKKRLLSLDGRWYNINEEVAIHHLVAGQIVNVSLSFDGSLERILPIERESLNL